MEIYNFFPTCVIGFDFTSYPNVSNLIRLILNTPSEDSFIINKGSSSYNSNYDFLSHPLLKDLKNNFQKSLDSYSKYTGIQSLKITNSWFNVMENEGKTHRHNHRGSTITGAYYPLLKKDTCNLIFYSPLHLILNSFDSVTPTSYNAPQTTFPLKPGYMYLFPSWLEHETEVNKGNKRIVISFNAI